MDTLVQNHARVLALRSPGSVRVGPFVLRYDQGWSSPFVNYAIPEDNADPSPTDISALIEAFRRHDRRPRLEFLPACAPLVESALLAAGFTVESRADVMACSAESLISPPAVDGLVISEPVDDDEYLAAVRVQRAAFSDPEPAGRGAIEGLRRSVAGGGVIGLGAIDGAAVATAGCSAPVDGVTELWGVAVVEPFRRRGIGAAITGQLTAMAFARGCRVVWLEPGEPWIGRIYGRVGFRTTGEKLSISLLD